MANKFKEIKVDSLSFMFPDDWLVIKYDDCSFYKENDHENIKAVDLLALDTDIQRLFIIESKDFRPKSKKDIPFNDKTIQEISQKVKNTLGFLLCAYLIKNRELDIFYKFLIEKEEPIFIILHMEREKSLKEKRSALITKLKNQLNIKFNIYDAQLLNEAFKKEQEEKDWWYVSP
ncbi:MAG: hypothetical protein SVR94_06435 [Pseudomonadota bacterium]|nr:hypothetical protein [Pseudomonadota bacterium]